MHARISSSGQPSLLSDRTVGPARIGPTRSSDVSTRLNGVFA